MSEGRLVALWLGCVLFALGCAEQGNVPATLAAFAAAVCATLLVKGHKP